MRTVSGPLFANKLCPFSFQKISSICQTNYVHKLHKKQGVVFILARMSSPPTPPFSKCGMPRSLCLQINCALLACKNFLAFAKPIMLTNCTKQWVLCSFLLGCLPHPLRRFLNADCPGPFVCR